MSGKRRGLLWVSPQGGLFSVMALAGLLAVALTVTADRGNAGGIDGLRAVLPGPGAPAGLVGSPPVVPSPTATPATATPPTAAPTTAAPTTAPTGPATISDPRAPTSTPGASPVPTATSVPAISAPTATPVPAAAPLPSASPAPALAPAPTTPPAATPAPVVSPTPVPTATPAPTPTPSPAPVALVTDRGAAALVSLGDIIPGDVITRTMAVQNTGTSAFRYTVSLTQTAATLLWTDLLDGLQLTVQDPGGTVLYTGPLSGLGTLAAPNVVAPGASDGLVYVFTLPATASNAFQGLAQDLTIVFTAVQYP